MKWKTFGRVGLAVAVSTAVMLGMTSCIQSFTIGYMYVMGQQYNQIGAFKIDNDTGDLTTIYGQPFALNGVNPVDAVITPGGRFMYVLAAGCGAANQPACGQSGSSQGSAPGSTSGSQIDLYSIGGSGVITFQQAYTSQGTNTVSIALNTSGTYLYALDRQAPDGSNQGDVTAFSVDQNTGRLTLITNQQQNNPTTGTALPYFKVGSNPVWFALAPSGGYLYTIEAGPSVNPSAADPRQAVFTYAVNSQTGQLTLTQNAPLPTGATNLTYISAGRGGLTSGSIFLLDGGGPGSNGSILPFTVGTTGNLQSWTGGAVPNSGQGGTATNPTNLITDSTGKFVYVADSGLNLGATSPASQITGYYVVTGPQLNAVGSSISFGTGAGPHCLIEDPSNQYIYTANYNDSTINGKVFNSEAGVLTPLRKRDTVATVGNPTWCVVSGTTF
jgi:6-phosphogluconolactonase